MRAYGSDRVRAVDDGAFVITCRLPKEKWEPRIPKTLTTSEHPGTAIQWDEATFEIVEREFAANGVRYTLAPWNDAHTIRVNDTYDEASEAKRVADRRDIDKRNKGRFAATLFGFVTGHLPAAVQDQIANETGANASLLTIMSAIPEMLPAIYWLNVVVNARIAQKGTQPLGAALLLVIGYAALDATVRSANAFLTRRPMGSLFGLIGYAIYYALSPNRARRLSPLKSERGGGIYVIEISKDLALIDAAKVREPLFTLLTPPEQEILATSYDYDYRHTAKSVAWTILVFALIGVVSSLRTLSITPRFSAFFSLITAGYLGFEQIVRLSQLSTRPAASVLAVIARPFARKFLARAQGAGRGAQER
jgi:hypothetical protein